MRQMHEEGEKHFGRINPSRTLSDDGFAFWKGWRPDAVKDDYRFHKDKLIGQPVTHPSGDAAHISSVGSKVLIATHPSTGTTFRVPEDQVEPLIAAASAPTAYAQGGGAGGGEYRLEMQHKGGYAEGGSAPAAPAGPKGPMLHVGPIHSAVAGRTDHLPMHVPSGSYVLPADIVSAHGEGNSMAGYKVMRRVFGGTPYAGKKEPYGHSGGPYSKGAAPYDQGDGPYGAKLGHAKGGKTDGVPIIAAGGEMVLSPEQVRRVGGGDLDMGHRVLDEFVKRSRKELIKTLVKLPGPRKD
jgi:hypothetical protein